MFLPFSGEEISYCAVSVVVEYADTGWAFEATYFAVPGLVECVLVTPM